MNEQEIIAYVRRALDEGARDLDGATVARLSALRHSALDRGQPRLRHHPGVMAWVQPRRAAVALALLVALAFAGWQQARQAELARVVETDLSLLTGELPPTIYADRIFGLWLKGYRR
jgi:hypothetical protein